GADGSAGEDEDLRAGPDRDHPRRVALAEVLDLVDEAGAPGEGEASVERPLEPDERADAVIDEAARVADRASDERAGLHPRRRRRGHGGVGGGRGGRGAGRARPPATSGAGGGATAWRWRVTRGGGRGASRSASPPPGGHSQSPASRGSGGSPASVGRGRSQT